MNAIYYQLICKITYDNNYDDFKLCILGDKNQSIFKFNKADERFIVYGDRLFDFEFDNFKKLNLSICFRDTNQIVDFLNKCLFVKQQQPKRKSW
jgi:ATP-dependent exoDNAse (exonuclease V) beta subunit